MACRRFFFTASTLLLVSALPLTVAQTKPIPAPPGDSLRVSVGPYHADVSYKRSDLQSMPRTTAVIHNPHSDADETYSGVRLADILGRLGVPVGKDLRGQALANSIIAAGSDGFKVALSIAEIDPALHPGDIIVADTLDGKPLPPDIGPFRLIVTEDKRPARAVRNLVSIELKILQVIFADA